MGASSEYEFATYSFLDGGVYSLVGDPDWESTPTGTWIFGFSAFRLLLDEMGLVAPRRLAGEPDPQPPALLRSELTGELADAQRLIQLQQRLMRLEGLFHGEDINQLSRSISIEAAINRVFPWAATIVQTGPLPFSQHVAVLPWGFEIVSVHAGYLREPESWMWESLVDKLTQGTADNRRVLVLFAEDEDFGPIRQRLFRYTLVRSSVGIAQWKTAVDTDLIQILRSMLGGSSAQPLDVMVGSEPEPVLWDHALSLAETTDEIESLSDMTDKELEEFIRSKGGWEN
jgi:hypothetical protein